MTPEQRTAVSTAIRLAAEGHVNCNACGTGKPCAMHTQEYRLVQDAWRALNDSETEARTRWERVKAAGDAVAFAVYDEWPSGCVQFQAAEEWEQVTGKAGDTRLRWEPGAYCGCEVVHRNRCGAVLSWHHGPTPFDADPAKMWCYRCGNEVLNIGDVWTCTGCDNGQWF